MTNLDLTIGLAADAHFIGKVEVLATTGATWFGDERSGDGLWCDGPSCLGSGERSLEFSHCGSLFLCQIELTVDGKAIRDTT